MGWGPGLKAALPLSLFPAEDTVSDQLPSSLRCLPQNPTTSQNKLFLPSLSCFFFQAFCYNKEKNNACFIHHNLVRDPNPTESSCTPTRVYFSKRSCHVTTRSSCKLLLLAPSLGSCQMPAQSTQLLQRIHFKSPVRLSNVPEQFTNSTVYTPNVHQA